LISANGRFELIHQEDNNLVMFDVHSDNNRVWETYTNGDGDPAVLQMKAEGTLELSVSEGMTYWWSGDTQIKDAKYEMVVVEERGHSMRVKREKSKKVGDTYFVLQDDGNGVIMHDGIKIWESGTSQGPAIKTPVAKPVSTELKPPRDRLKNGEKLFMHESLDSKNGRFRLLYNGEGKLVLYDKTLNDKIIHTIDMGYGEKASLIMQQDGNLVLYGDYHGGVEWSTEPVDPDGLEGPPGNCELVVQDDGNVMILYDGKCTWETRTWIRDDIKQVGCLRPGEVMNPGDSMLSANKRYRLRLNADRNLVLYDEHDKNREIWNPQLSCADRFKFKLMLDSRGKLALMDDGNQVWSTGTNDAGTYIDFFFCLPNMTFAWSSSTQLLHHLLLSFKEVQQASS
jgi:hypothetical protein